MIHPDVDASGRPVTVLELDERVGLANRYALMVRSPRAGDDPVHATESGLSRPAGWLFSQ